MAPLIASMVSNGLGLLANAAMAKGKEWVEEKVGVKIDETRPLDQDKIVELKKAEMAHEEELLRIRQDDDRLGLAWAELAVKDMQGARDHDTNIATSANAPLLNKVITPVLALIVVLGGGAILAWGAPDIRPLAVGLMATVLGFYFGTSIGSREKQQIIDRMTQK